MTFFPDLCESTMVSTGKHVRAIGWLSKEHVYTTGSTTDEFASRLAKICQNWTSCPEDLGFGMFMGWHTCEFCGRFRADGNIGIPAGDLLYIAPEMIHHYVTAHQYSPPSEFIDAIMACPVPGTPEFTRLCRPFRALQDAYVNERWNRMVTQAAIWARDNGGECVFPQAALRFLSSSCAEYAEQVRTAFEALTKKDG